MNNGGRYLFHFEKIAESSGLLVEATAILYGRNFCDAYNGRNINKIDRDWKIKSVYDISEERILRNEIYIMDEKIIEELNNKNILGKNTIKTEEEK